MRKLFYILVCIVAVLQLGSFISINLGGGAFSEPDLRPIQTGLQTNIVELTRFNSQITAESGSGTATTDLAELQANANSAKDSWAYNILAGSWGSKLDECTPATVGIVNYKDTFTRGPGLLVALNGATVGDDIGGWQQVSELTGSGQGPYINSNGSVQQFGGVGGGGLLAAGRFRAINTNEAATLSQYAAIQISNVASEGAAFNRRHGVTVRGTGLGAGSPFYAFFHNSQTDYGIQLCKDDFDCGQDTFIYKPTNAQMGGQMVQGDSIGIEVNDGIGDEIVFSLWHWSQTSPPDRDNWGAPNLTVCKPGGGCDAEWVASGLDPQRSPPTKYYNLTVDTARRFPYPPADTGKRGGFVTGNNQNRYRFDNWMFGDSDTYGGSTDPQFDVEKAASDIFAMALYGSILDIQSDTSGDAYFAAVKTRLQEFEAINYIQGRVPNATDPNTNTCVVDFSKAITQLLESGWLLESSAYSSWLDADRETLAQWAASTIFTPASWAAKNKKNYWGIHGIAATMSIAAYGQAIAGVDTLTIHPAEIIDTPEYLVNKGETYLTSWIANRNVAGAATFRDSACYAAGSGPYGLQPNGAFPDSLFEEVGLTADCGRTSLEFSCGSSTTKPVRSGCGLGHAIQQETTVALSKTCEIFRRVDIFRKIPQAGSRCFDLKTHDTNPASREALYDAIAFSTTAVAATGGTNQGTFNDFFTTDDGQGYRYVASTYYNDFCMYYSLSDGSVSVRGGYIHPYTKITHREGVAHTASLTAQSIFGCATFGTTAQPESTWGTSGVSLFGSGVWGSTLWGN